MRSPKELALRLKQEAANAWLLANPPSPAIHPNLRIPGLPDPAPVFERLQGSDFARSVEDLAGQILNHSIPVLGYTLETGPEISWRRDYIHAKESGCAYFRRIPYLDFERVGDHKLVWELNRHQHLVLLAQAYRFTGRKEFLQEISVQLESWLSANPYQRGMNWASALEVAFRALSWTWLYHFAGEALDLDLRSQLLTGLYRHGLHLEHNLSIYFSPNTHLLGEAVALHALGVLFPTFPGAKRWARKAIDIVRKQMQSQVRDDGSHFEQSSYYHIYALDLFLFHAALAQTMPEYRARLRRMAEYLRGLMGPRGALSLIGDDDGGRVFHPYGPRDRFGRATLATCAVMFDHPEWLQDSANLHEQAVWWLGEKALAAQPGAPEAFRSQLFPQAGMAVMRAGDLRVLMNAGPFGFGGAGHSHADKLSILVDLGEEEILVDAGTYTYVSDPKWRNWFRSTAAHNTVRVDGRDQAAPAGPFRWASKPEVIIADWLTLAAFDYVDASCAYGLRHRRRALLLKPDLLFILDELSGPKASI